MLKHLFFDLDGTLVNSSKGIKNAFKYTFSKLDMPTPNEKILSTFIGPPLETTFSHFFDNTFQINQAITFFRDYYQEKGVHEVKLYDKIPLALDILSQSYQLFVTTSKHEPSAYQMLSELDVDDYFTAIYGSTANRFVKEDIIATCLNKHFIKPETAAIIGDTKFDMIGGKRQHINCIGVTWGFGKKDDLVKYGANTIITSPIDLINYLT
ncbi:HAD hydrolase-like protein [Streptococcus sciuri]|uniref:HAD hydrolase-like protein n=1 Tax=Streptococcus sciuri TaxID=2973939 RepID=A0ABT2F660_9STRE|nr:HAD hydrolase-like protein [Streptococcus sciuri]MCS4487958.1 HAD hydrolase-like protein [Streptococcus sciuri]